MNPAYALAGTCLLIAGCVWASDRYGLVFLHRLLGGGSQTWTRR